MATTTVPIAVIGMSCRFAGGANSPERLWEMCEAGRSAWSKIPSTRFNDSAFYHPDGSRSGTSNVTGGHFLDEDLSVFDAAFFNFSAETARSLDPQFRMQLETVFEALENAGLTLDQISASRTSVYAGAFFRDHHDALMRDVETMPRLFMTGNGAAMSANRISHFFDLRGPSITVDTGCSTALAALHLGCQSLRNGEAEVSVISAANLMINPDMFISMSSLGFLSPDGKSYAFDERANGYGRGEGVSAIILKPLQAALKDGDTVRAVIRETALNQDGRTPTITLPSQVAQQELIRSCYAKCGLSPSDTSYIEAHGTGTQAGDPIEAAAIGIEIGQRRPAGHKLLMGSVKTNIGHCEAASGLASIIKVVKSIESGVIAPSINYGRPNPNLSLEEWNIEIPTTPRAWPDPVLKRASISNFGYGGCNAHVIIEDPRILLNASLKIYPPISTNPQERPMILMYSGNDRLSVDARKKQLLAYLRDNKVNDDQSVAALIHTLNTRRSMLSWRNFAFGNSTQDLIESLQDASHVPVKAISRPLRIALTFTGQGAQYAAMGAQLIDRSVEFLECLQECEKHLQSLGVAFSLLEELRKPAPDSRVHEPGMSLVLCTALQVGLVDLLRSWNITPCAIVSHSSGEVAAAYAAGAIDLFDAMAIVFTRMHLSTTSTRETNAIQGGMLAVGISRDQAQAYLDALVAGKVVVACENSPSSVTLSGDIAGIDALEKELVANGIFARKLRVSVAYHSHHMLSSAPEYLAKLNKIFSSRPSTYDATRPYQGKFYSPVTGRQVTDLATLNSQHWVNNMTGCVLFFRAFEAMCTENKIDLVIEVGPHGALGGPIRQIMNQSTTLSQQKVDYLSCLTRGLDGVQSLSRLAGELWKRGHPTDSAPLASILGTAGRQDGAKVLVDLPTYPWTHDVQHWQEPIANRKHRFREAPNHDFLGFQETTSSSHTPSWRNIIKTSAMPWIHDHKVQDAIVYPAAGMICMAIEAVVQLQRTKCQTVHAIELQDLDFSMALAIPDNEQGVEVRLCMWPCSERQLLGEGRYQFSLLSQSDSGKSIEHCSGLIMAVTTKAEDIQTPTQLALQELLTADVSLFHRRQNSASFYESLRALDIHHGPAFQQIVDVRKHHTSSVCKFHVADTRSLMPKECESEHVIHPITLDNVFQAAYTALPYSPNISEAKIPRTIKAMTIHIGITSTPGDALEVWTYMHHNRGRSFSTSAAVRAADGQLLVEIDRLLCQSIGSAQVELPASADRLVQMKAVYHPSLTLNGSEKVQRSLQLPQDEAQRRHALRLQRASLYYMETAVSQLTSSDISQFQEHQLALYDWMRRQLERSRAGIEPFHGFLDTHQKSSPSAQTFLEAVKTSSVNGEMICHVGSHLIPILRNQEAALEIMLEGRLLYRYYEQDFRMLRIYQHVSRLVSLLMHERPGSHVLEIGGGTGGCTSAVLDVSDVNLASYDFTDISAGFFAQAREKFDAWSNIMRYKKLDIESDLAFQGFKDASYDGVVACRVLHATRNMTHTMKNVARLLKPGGWLLMVEDTVDALDTQLAFGVLPGWWLGEEPTRKDSPTLREHEWQDLLRQTGFDGIDIIAHDYEDCNLRSSSVILARRTSEVETIDEPVTPKNIRMWHSAGAGVPPEEWIRALEQKLAPCTVIASLLPPGIEPGLDDICIILDHFSSHKTLLSSPEPEMYSLVRAILTNTRHVLWVSRGGAITSPICDAALHLGLLRTLRCENTQAKYVSLDLDPRRTCWSDTAVDAIVNVARKTVLNDSLGPLEIETECAERAGILLSPRILPDLGVRLSSDDRPVPFHSESQHLKLAVKTPGLLDSIHFCHSGRKVTPLGSDEVEITPFAFGLNFRDVMIAMDQLDFDNMGFETSGVVKAAGSASELRPGDRVCALLRGDWSNSARVHVSSVAKVPDWMTLHEAASVPMAFVTAYCCLIETARCSKGQSILIHAAAGGVGQAAIMIAQWLEMDVFVTVGSHKKREFLRSAYNIPDHKIFSSRSDLFARQLMTATNNRGVDVALNSLSGTLLQATWRCIARFGHFVEIGKRDIARKSLLAMDTFDRNVSFSSVDLIQLGEYNPAMISRAFGQIMQLLDSKQLRTIGPITTYALADLELAMRLMQSGNHIGKIVIDTAPGTTHVTVSPGQARPVLSENATYILVGGLGGLGMSILEHFVALGAKNVVVLSRTASKHAESSPAVQLLCAQGCNVQAHDCDAADPESLSLALDWVRTKMPPVRGVVQAAMVLRDVVFENMTHVDFTAALLPKRDATHGLHYHFSSRSSLDFFIMLSSFAGVGGNVSQANYASGGTYQDALMRYRASLGLPGVCIDLGAVASVGYVAETPGVAQRLAKMHYRPLQEDEVLQCIDEAIRSPVRSPQESQVITGISMASADELSGIPGISYRGEPRFRAMLRSNTATGSSLAFNSISSESSPGRERLGDSLRASLQQTSDVLDAVKVIEGAVRHKIGEMFLISAADIEASQPLSKYGVDSLVAVELRNWLAAQSGSSVTIFDVLQSATITALAERTAATSKFLK